MTVENAEPAAATAGLDESREATRSARLPRLPVDIRSLALSLIAVAVVILLLQHMQAVLIPFVLAALMFYALDPAVDRMQAWHVPRAIGAALMILIVVASVLGLVYFLQDEAAAMVERLPQGIQRARDQLKRGRGDPPGMLATVDAAAKELETASASGKQLQNKQTASGATRVQVETPAFSASQYLWSGSVGA